jgi:LCP family protein required for cell wall assembly
MNEFQESRSNGSQAGKGGRSLPFDRPTDPGAGPTGAWEQGWGAPPEPTLPPESWRRPAAGAYQQEYGSGTVYGRGVRPFPPGPPGPPFPPGPPGTPRPGGRRTWRRRITLGVLGLVVVLVMASVGTYIWVDQSLSHTVNLAAMPNRPPADQGTTYLIAGSDNRQNLTAQQQQQLHTGSDNEGPNGNSDTMMLLHTGAHGDTLVSLPRDSYVTIPAFTSASGQRYPATTNKLNAAYSEGGGQLLAETVEYNTGIHIDHYAEIGFGGFVNLVDSLGGTTICFNRPLVDPASGADFKAGCQKINGEQALELVRERHQDASQDLSREANQQQFLSAVAHQAETPSVLLDPFRLYPALDAGIKTLSVDQSMSPYDLAQMFLALKAVSGGSGRSLTVPIANANYLTPNAGDALLWNMSQAKTLFHELQNDQTVTIKNDDASSDVSHN